MVRLKEQPMSRILYSMIIIVVTIVVSQSSDAFQTVRQGRQQHQQQQQQTQRQQHPLSIVRCDTTYIRNAKSSRMMMNPLSMVNNDNAIDVIISSSTSITAYDSIMSTVSSSSSSSILLAETEAWVQPLSLVLDPFLNFMSFAMLARVVLSWYPELKLKDNPWTIIVVFPTETLLRIVKGVIPPAFGVDITPVFWLAIFTFVHEILLGQQGLLTMKLKYGI